MNCTIRKTKNASVARYFPSSSGVYVLDHVHVAEQHVLRDQRPVVPQQQSADHQREQRLRPANRIFAKA